MNKLLIAIFCFLFVNSFTMENQKEKNFTSVKVIRKYDTASLPMERDLEEWRELIKLYQLDKSISKLYEIGQSIIEFTNKVPQATLQPKALKKITTDDKLDQKAEVSKILMKSNAFKKVATQKDPPNYFDNCNNKTKIPLQKTITKKDTTKKY